MSREFLTLKKAKGGLGKTSSPLDRKALLIRCLRAVGFRPIFLSVILATGTVSLSCSGSTENTNNRTQASPVASSTPSSIPTSVAAAKSASPATSTPVANSVPKTEQVAEPKKIIPAPTVVAVGKGPRIAFTNEEIDFGDVDFNDVVQAPFEFKNVGDEPLMISKVQVEVGEGC